MVSAGEALNPEVIDAWREVTGVTICDGYGQTETGHLVGNHVGEAVREGSMGRALPGVELRVAEGELQVRVASCPTFFDRYLDDEPFAEEWWSTGDVARADDDGYYWYEGRNDDLIVSAGYRIGPFEVESALLSHPAVAEAAAVAAPDSERGAVVRAIVVLRAGEPGEELARELQDHVKAVTAPTSTRAWSSSQTSYRRPRAARSSAPKPAPRTRGQPSGDLVTSAAMPSPRSIQRTYLTLMLGNTLAASFIWGINTIFLLDAGLSNAEAFAANAFFTAGMVIFEVPTGIVADTVGRRTSYLLGTVTLTLSTAIYVLLWQLEAPFWEWALVSMLLGLGFTFFSGAVEAWLTRYATGFDGDLESVFGRGQIVSGIAMLTGSVAGGLIAQATSLGVLFVARAGVLVVMFVVAYRLMHDVGFAPDRRQRPLAEMRRISSNSIEYGWRVPAVKWLMLSSLFSGVGIYAFYALQPYLLELYGDPTAYSVAGLVAAIVAGAQILGGIAAPRIRRSSTGGPRP